MGCKYEFWDRERKRLTTCGKGCHGSLCDEHRAFVEDCRDRREINYWRLVEKQRKAKIKDQIARLTQELKA